MGTEISLSSNTLFHFTNNADNLMEILSTGFKPKFCLEQFGITDLHFNELEKGKLVPIDNFEEAVPMTCFCDLPVSHISSHLEFYGSNGIGLTKEWGISKGLTPITYIHNNSAQMDYIRKLAKIIWQSTKGKKIALKDDPRILLIELAGFFKPYKGEMWRINKYVTKKFYDEREWRFIPCLQETDLDGKEDYRLNKTEFLNDIKRAKANKYVAQHHVLKFEFKDIKYIIIKSDSEATAMTETINSLPQLTNKEKNLLITRIISTQQIKEDF